MRGYAKTWIAFLALFCNSCFCVNAFAIYDTVQPRNQISGGQISLSSTRVPVLSERQMQFWEDANDGIEDMAILLEGKMGKSMDKIRGFARSAQGIDPKPFPSCPGHDPSEEHINGLASKPFWDARSEDGKRLFPWAEELEKKSDVIVKECQQKLQEERKMAEKGMFSRDSSWQNKVMGKGWAAIRLRRLGVWNPKNCDEFPKTYDLLRSLNIPFAVRGVCFAQQLPNTGVLPHSDGRNFILTAHLGLKIPDGCWMKVGEEVQAWKEGKLTIIDTSFTHSTSNPTDSERNVLIIDFWHPELTKAERKGLEFVYDLRNKFEKGQVPFRRPRSLKEEKPQGLLAWWQSVVTSAE